MSPKGTNIPLANSVIELCVNSGIKDFVICAGARNAPFVKILGASQSLSVSYFYDERSAAFFALGRAKRDLRPVAVVTTSGTAVAELLPTAVEAYYSGYPLVFITADRPKNFRGSGSPQSIEQVQIFGEYALPTLDLDHSKDVPQNWENWSNNCHINVCFSEPLIDFEIKPIVYKENSANNYLQSQTTTKDIDSLDQFKKPLILISTLENNEQAYVSDLLAQTSFPIYVESTSGFRINSEMNILTSAQLKNINYPQDFDCVVRIGGVPTVRFWRDLESKLSHVPVFSFSRLAFTGLGRNTAPVQPILALKDFYLKLNANGFENRINKSAENLLNKSSEQKNITVLTDRFPKSEPALIYAYLQNLNENDEILVGNSLPIRELDLFTSTLTKKIKVTANRGANGIDGLISTALGRAQNNKNMHVLLGDLSALYDLNALSQDKYSDAKNITIVVINNKGGKIFKTMFKDVNFENRHEWRFKSWAEMFGYNYKSFTSTKDLLNYSSSESKNILELLPDENETEVFWDEYNK